MTRHGTGVDFEGARSAFRHVIIDQITCESILTVGKPKLMRGDDVNESDYEKARKMTWSELFFDLIFVTGARRLGEMLRAGMLESNGEDGSDSGDETQDFSLTFLQYFVLFLALWSLWVEQANYGTRFGANDVYNFLHFSGFMAGVVGFVCCLGQPGSYRTSLMFLAAGFSFVVGLISHVRVCYYFVGRRAFRYAFSVIVYSTILIGFCVFGYMQPEMWLLPMTVIAVQPYVRHTLLVTLLKFQQCTGFKGVHIPYHIEHYTERISLLMVIYLGDGIENLTNVSSEEQPPFARFALGFVTLLALKVLLLDACEVEAERHAIRRSPWTTLLYFMAMPAQAIGLALISSGLAMALLSTPSAHNDSRWLLGDGTAIVLAAFMASALAHKPPEIRGDTTNTDSRCARLEALLMPVYILQLTLNFASTLFCIGIAHLHLPCLQSPTVVLTLLSVLLTFMGVINLLDEFLEAQVKDLREESEQQTPQQFDKPEFDVALRRLGDLLAQNPKLRETAIRALQSNAFPNTSAELRAEAEEEAEARATGEWESYTLLSEPESESSILSVYSAV